MPGRIPAAGFSADEIMVLQRIAMGYDPGQIAQMLLMESKK